MTFLFRRPRLLALFVLLPALLLTAGCQHTAYSGAEPTSRSFYEDPDVRQCYIGVDLSFALDDPPPHVPGSPMPAWREP